MIGERVRGVVKKQIEVEEEEEEEERVYGGDSLQKHVSWLFVVRISPCSLRLIAKYRAALISRRDAEVYLIFIRLAFNHFMTYVTQHISSILHI